MLIFTQKEVKEERMRGFLLLFEDSHKTLEIIPSISLVVQELEL
jgi:hypothetical protein